MVKKNSRENKAHIKLWESIRLTTLEDCDIEKIFEWTNVPSIRDLTMHPRLPVPKQSVMDWVNELRHQRSVSKIVFGIRVSNELVGMALLHELDQFQRKTIIGLYIGGASNQSRGIGFVATSLLIDYAFNGLDLRKISLEVISENNKAINLYKKLGFIHEGTKREDYFLDGKCFDVSIYGMLRSEFLVAIPRGAHRLVMRSSDLGASDRA